MENKTAISTYHEYMLEGIAAVRHGFNLVKHANSIDEYSESDYSGLFGMMSYRYGIIMIANSIEAAANALLLGLKRGSKFYEELERLPTLLKFELFCELSGKRLDRGDVRYSRIAELIKWRNDFVHPKPKSVEYSFKDNSITYATQKTKNRKYSTYHIELHPDNTLDALEDTLKFISWICFDVCKFKIQDGALKLGFGSFGSTADLDILIHETGRNFDKRTFGIY